MSLESNSLCQIEGQGGVGESGSYRLISATVSGDAEKAAVVRVTGSNLCPNTGVIGVLTVNGEPVANGSLSEAGDLLQAPVNPNDRVCAVAVTIPLFNQIQCFMLGELEFNLEICDLE